MISRDLNRKGIGSFDRRIHDAPEKSEWHPNSVGRILRNPAVLGWWQPMRMQAGKRVPVGDPIMHYPAIIEQAVFDRVQVALTARKKAPGRRGRHFRNLFIGLGSCVCGGSLRVHEGRSSFYLRCARSKHAACVNKVGYPIARYEEQFLGLFGVGFDKLLADMIPRPQADTRYEDQAVHVAGIENRLQAMMAEFGNQADPVLRSAALPTIRRLSEELSTAKAALAAMAQMTRFESASDDGGFVRRLAEARAKLVSADAAEQFAIRAKLSGELARRIDSMVLHPDRSIVTRINGGSNRVGQIEVRFTPTEIPSVITFDEADVVLTDYGRTWPTLLAA